MSVVQIVFSLNHVDWFLFISLRGAVTSRSFEIIIPRLGCCNPEMKPHGVPWLANVNMRRRKVFFARTICYGTCVGGEAFLRELFVMVVRRRVRSFNSPAKTL